MLRLALALTLALSGCSLGADLASYTPVANTADTGDDTADVDASLPDVTLDTPPDTDDPQCVADEDCPTLPGTRSACGDGVCVSMCEDPFVDVNADLSDLDGDGCECQSAGAERCETPEDDDCDGLINEDCCDPSEWTFLPKNEALKPPTQPAVVVGRDGTTVVAWVAVDAGANPLSTVQVAVLSHDFTVIRTFDYGLEEKLSTPKLAGGDDGFLLAFSSSARRAIVWDRLTTEGVPSGNPPQPFHPSADAAAALDVAIVNASPILAYLARDPTVCEDRMACLALTGPANSARRFGSDIPDDATLRSIDIHARGASLVVAADVNLGDGRSQIYWYQSRNSGTETSFGEFFIAELEGVPPTVGVAVGTSESMLVRLVSVSRQLRPRFERLDQQIGLELARPDEATSTWAVQTAAGVGALWHEPDAGLYYGQVSENLNAVVAVKLDEPHVQPEYAVSGQNPWGGFVVVRTTSDTVAIRAFSPEGQPVCPSLD